MKPAAQLKGSCHLPDKHREVAHIPDKHREAAHLPDKNKLYYERFLSPSR